MSALQVGQSVWMPGNHLNAKMVQWAELHHYTLQHRPIDEPSFYNMLTLAPDENTEPVGNEWEAIPDWFVYIPDSTLPHTVWTDGIGFCV